MPEIDPMKEAEDDFLDAVSVAAKALAQAVKRDAARKVFAQMSLGLDHTESNAEPPVVTAGTRLMKRRGVVGYHTPDMIITQLIAYVKKHPGLRIEQLNVRFGTKTGDLARLVSQAIASGKLVTKGQARGRKYYPGKKA